MLEIGPQFSTGRDYSNRRLWIGGKGNSCLMNIVPDALLLLWDSQVKRLQPIIYIPLKSNPSFWSNFRIDLGLPM